MSTEPLLVLKGVEKHFNIGGSWGNRSRTLRAVDDLDLVIHSGEVVALVGESGSGKSTTGRLIARLLSATSGQMKFDGRVIDLDEEPGRPFRKEIQIVFQDPRAALNPRRSIFKALRDPMLLHGVSTNATVREDVGRLLERVGLSPFKDYIDRLPRQLSGGQLQRVCIARALSLRPKLIVADEAVSALDASVRAQILELLARIQSEDNLAILFITHDLGVVKRVAQRVAVMYLGKIVEQGPTDKVFSRPAHPYTAALISATPIPDPVRARSRKRIVLQGEIPSPANPPSGCRFHPRCSHAIAVCKEVFPSPTDVMGVVASCHRRLDTSEPANQDNSAKVASC